MSPTTVRRGRRVDSVGFLKLLLALARFENLQPPSVDGQKRILAEIFEKKRLNLFVASERGKLVGYALCFYTYSSFLARPTLFLEDLFVLEEHRRKGLGFALFLRCVDEAIRQGCGRMEWAVLGWNKKAIDFYEKLSARRLDEWHFYRLTLDELKQISHKNPEAARLLRRMG
ncbi:MAG: GNAT family N-acetyltransferase [Nitrososphaerales archaeon]